MNGDHGRPTPPVYVYTGPTLRAAEVERVLPDSIVRPPVQRGDVLRAVGAGATAIAIIDGYFEVVPSVWHKEIVEALARGVAVYGASSMGAIRAAELGPLGMVGVGAVAAALAAGHLDDDDVMLAHASAEDDYRALSEPMVNIRWTLQAAVRAGVIDEPIREHLDRTAKSLFYPDRTFAAMAARSRDDGIPDHALDRLSAWWHPNRVDIKRLDALELLERVVDDQRAGVRAPARPRAPRTHHFVRHLVAEERNHGDASRGRAHTVLDELRLDPAGYGRVSEAATLRQAMIALAEASAYVPDQRAIDAASDDLRTTLGLLQPADLERWLRERQMSADDYAQLAERHALYLWGRQHTDLDRFTGMVDIVHLSPELTGLAPLALSRDAVADQARVTGELTDGDLAVVTDFAERATGREAGTVTDADIAELVSRLDLPSTSALAGILWRTAAGSDPL